MLAKMNTLAFFLASVSFVLLAIGLTLRPAASPPAQIKLVHSLPQGLKLEMEATIRGNSLGIQLDRAPGWSWKPAVNAPAGPGAQAQRRCEGDISLTVINGSNRPVTVLGSGFACTRQCCIYPNGFPIRMEPWSAAALRLHLSLLLEPGDFDLPSVDIYTDRDKAEEASLGFKGKVVPL